MPYKAPFPQQGDGIGLTKPAPLRPYISSTAEKFAPGNFVTTWDGQLGINRVGVTRAIADKTDANPHVLVKWMEDLSEEWVRSEYLYLAN